jgi:hypothetical protein
MTYDINYYLAEWGGAASDRAYKDAGGFMIIGPFASTDEAWDFCRVVSEGCGSEYSAPYGYEVVTVDGVIVEPYSPRDRLTAIFDPEYDPEHAQDQSEREEVRLQLDRWWPEWQDDLENAIAKAEADRQRREAECEQQGHDWGRWSPLFGADHVEYRHCQHCWVEEHRPASGENLERILASERPR